MKIFFTGCILCWALITMGQNVVQVEYFIDKDAGPGNNTLINVIPLADGTFPVTADFTGVSGGHHFLYLRSRDSDGSWSFTARRSIVVAPQSTSPLIAGEYFIDTDPGFGSAGVIALSAPDSLVLQGFTAAVSGLKSGFHKLYGRFRNADGNWSITFRRNIEVIKTFTPNQLVSVEYFFSDDKGDNGVGNCASISFSNPLQNGTFSFTIPKENVPPGADTLFLRVRDSIDNDWSITQYRPGAIVLPLTLISFTATRQQELVQLHWQTANEINMAYFNIQRSIDGRRFTKIGSLNAKGNNRSQSDYSYTDNIQAIEATKVYYRLEMADKDGKSSYSPVKVVSNPAQINFAITPNPVQGNVVNLVVTENKRAQLTLSIYNIEGQKFMTGQFNAEIGTSARKIDVSDFASGLYFIEIGDGETLHRLKFVR
jgi:Secretion system C-terminal sorting domain